MLLKLNNNHQVIQVTFIKYKPQQVRVSNRRKRYTLTRIRVNNTLLRNNILTQYRMKNRTGKQRETQNSDPCRHMDDTMLDTNNGSRMSRVGALDEFRALAHFILRAGHSANSRHVGVRSDDRMFKFIFEFLFVLISNFSMNSYCLNYLLLRSVSRFLIDTVSNCG